MAGGQRATSGRAGPCRRTFIDGKLVERPEQTEQPTAGPGAAAAVDPTTPAPSACPASRPAPWGRRRPTPTPHEPPGRPLRCASCCTNGLRIDELGWPARCWRPAPTGWLTQTVWEFIRRLARGAGIDNWTELSPARTAPRRDHRRRRGWRGHPRRRRTSPGTATPHMLAFLSYSGRCGTLFRPSSSSGPGPLGAWSRSPRTQWGQRGIGPPEP